MPQKLDKLDHKYNEKLTQIRRSNIERHAGYANTLKLKQNIQRFQRNATYDMELQRLRGATATGTHCPSGSQEGGRSQKYNR